MTVLSLGPPEQTLKQGFEWKQFMLKVIPRNGVKMWERGKQEATTGYITDQISSIKQVAGKIKQITYGISKLIKNTLKMN